MSTATDAAVLRSVADESNIVSLDAGLTRVAAAALGDQILGCAWVARDAFDEHALGLRFLLKSPEAWLFAAVVLPQWRGRGVYGQLLEFVINESMQQGIRRILLGVTVGNSPSRRAHARHGASKVGTIFAVRSLGVSFCLRSGRVRRLSRRPIAWRRPIELSVE